MNSDPIKQALQWLETERGFGITEAKATKGATSVSPADGAGLSGLYEAYKDCRLCALCETRNKFVFGAGDPRARLMFIGEAPGADEDQQGLPFVGKAGQLLTKIIEAMRLTRDEVYIANTLKCRPPENRAPLPSETAACRPLLLRQIELIRPEVICALGKHAAQAMLGTEEPIGKLRGRFHDWKGIPLMPTFHPAYLLRNPEDKKIVWADMQLIMRRLGIAVPVKK